VTNVLSSHLLSKKIQIKIYKTIILLVVLYQNLVSYIKGETQTEVVRELGAKKNIWTKERQSDSRMEKTE
jgi:hypothetical protein